MKAYEESLKVYRDNKNTMDYAIETARIEAKKERDIEIAKKLKKRGVDFDIIAETTNLTKEQKSISSE